MVEIEIPSTEIVLVSDLKEDSQNPNVMTRKQLDALKEGIKRFGFIIPIITNRDLLIADGAQRLTVAKELGLEKVPVVRLDVQDVDRRILRMTLNKLRGEHDSGLDSEEFKRILELGGAEDLALLLGDSDKKLVQFLATIGKNLGEDNLDVDKALAAPKYEVKLGDIWQLGEHRLMCGDSTNGEAVSILLNGKEIELQLSDPPYGVAIMKSDGTAGASAVPSFIGAKGVVHARQYHSMVGEGEKFNPSHMFAYGKTQIIWGANYFSDLLPVQFHWIVWDKKANSGADHNNFSDAELAWTNVDRKNVVIYRHLWSGMVRQGDRAVELKERVHPFQKPVGLLVDILRDYSNIDDNVLDLYAGSGSVLIACEQSNRKCLCMEIDPFYCSVLIERFENLTGLKANKIVNGVKEVA